VRGPNPGSRSNPTVQDRRESLSGAINELNLDVLVVVEGPNKSDELQLFFDTDVQGDWHCDVQPTKGSSQIIGIAVRTDTNKFANPPLTRFHVGEGQGGEAERISNATVPFLLDTDDDELKEQHRFERLPLYAQVNIADGKKFRVLGLHLKSKGIFDTLEWSRWWSQADANRKKIVAQCRQLRKEFLDHYLTEEQTRDTALIVCGDINDGPGMDTSERKLNTSGIERLMGTVWKPTLTLRNALFDSLSDEEQHEIDLESVYTTSFRDPMFNNYRKVWIDHLLYSNNKPQPWIANARAQREFADPNGGKQMIWSKYPHASDHHPVVAEIDSDLL
jgi:endonuclease/exonuclease/phosphatase family metal-dependent hydrolase